MLPRPDRAHLARALPRLALGLVLCGTGIAAMVLADLGLGPWDVLHQGLSDRTGIPIGTVTIGVGFLVLLAWVPLRERVGIGTLANVVVIGLVVDGWLAVVDAPSSVAVRVPLVALGPVLFGVGSGLYIGAALGPGPRDGLMTGLARRGAPTWSVRAGLELTALAVGAALGGTVGVGTVWFALGIGPLVHLALRHLSLDPPPGAGAPGGRVSAR
ncbi:hypothetical protein PO878_10010 [Iamia majanohamensis]|uniref:Membrane protein YczE n=1 Tax=Iamia majanohamensis TaxID=467976 RepID=A0AAE9YDY6_9ACTN|nr:hypothetical protein [Iamia majanohamensis]WCO69059.1 hypothetical protein PO878_10010 [Iamia majanohamensis]